MSLLSFRIAIQSLSMNRVRSGLTTLGIIIGVASITLVLSLGGGIQDTVQRQVTKLGNNVILVRPGHSESNSTNIEQYNPYSITTITSLTEQDMNSINGTENVKQSAPIMVIGGSVKAGDSGTATAPIVATTPELASILGLKIGPGQFIDNQTARETAVIGKKLAIELYGTDQILGRQIALKGRNHTVIGVVKETNAPINLSGIDLDRTVYISFDDGKSFNLGVAQIQQFLVTALDVSKLEATKQALDKTLVSNHYGERDFSILAGKEISTNSDIFFRAIVMMTALIAGITLVVGGVGIMNIMLVGVSERTREIGIRKALGATNQHILGQFLIEALIMCFIGGAVGLAVAYGLAFFIAGQLSFQPSITWQIAAFALSIAFATGIIFGLYPAVKAARKDPIESLRQYH